MSWQGVDVLFMQSDGGLTPMEQFCGSRAVLSGPAGGVVGYAITSYGFIENKPIIGFDMGGEMEMEMLMLMNNSIDCLYENNKT